jgi:hypothetical protein
MKSFDKSNQLPHTFTVLLISCWDNIMDITALNTSVFHLTDFFWIRKEGMA